MDSSIGKGQSSSAFPPEKQIPTQSIFHSMIENAVKRSGEIQLRGFKKQDIWELVFLQKEWFPIDYSASFYQRIIRDEVRCIIAESQIIIPYHKYKSIVRAHNSKKTPFKVTHPNDLPPFYEEEPSKIDNEHNVKCKVIVGGVVFESTNSRGYLEEGWWRSVLGENANSYYIMTIGVIEEYRKKGIAQMLLDAVEKAASLQPHIKFIYLHVIDYNHAAIKLYTRTGFTEIEHLHHFYNIQHQQYDGIALGKFLKDGKRKLKWWNWMTSWWS